MAMNPMEELQKMEEMGATEEELQAYANKYYGQPKGSRLARAGRGTLSAVGNIMNIPQQLIGLAQEQPPLPKTFQRLGQIAKTAVTGGEQPYPYQWNQDPLLTSGLRALPALGKGLLRKVGVNVGKQTLAEGTKLPRAAKAEARVPEVEVDPFKKPTFQRRGMQLDVTEKTPLPAPRPTSVPVGGDIASKFINYLGQYMPAQDVQAVGKWMLENPNAPIRNIAAQQMLRYGKLQPQTLQALIAEAKPAMRQPGTLTGIRPAMKGTSFTPPPVSGGTGAVEEISNLSNTDYANILMQLAGE